MVEVVVEVRCAVVVVEVGAEDVRYDAAVEVADSDVKPVPVVPLLAL